MTSTTAVKSTRVEILDWLKGWAIIAVVLDHTKTTPGLYVFWSVNIFVLVTAISYSKTGYSFSFGKLILKILNLLFLVSLAIFFFKAINTFFSLPAPNLSSVFLNPYAFLVKNPYLGDIWYIALHLQFLVLFFFALKNNLLKKPKLIWALALVITTASWLVTHIWLNRFHTILVSTWLVFLCAGFYFLNPFLNTIRKENHGRGRGLVTGLALIACWYALYPAIPWAFTHTHRASIVNLPFYFALILFLAEWFYMLEANSSAKKFTHLITLLGRHTLAIYLTHEPFERVLRQFFSPHWLLAILSVGCGILFGTAADYLWAALKKVTIQMKEKNASSPEVIPLAQLERPASFMAKKQA